MKYFNTIIVIIFALLLLTPLFWMINGAFRMSIGVIKMPPDMTLKSTTLRNFASLFKYPVWYWVLNSFIISMVCVVLGTLINTMAGYAFAKKAIPFKEPIFWMFVCSMMIPGQIAYIPLFLLVKDLGLYNTRIAMILPGLSSAFFIFFLRQYLKKFPDDLLWTAEIDGCGDLRKFFSVVLPLSKPALAVVATMTFFGTWGNFFWQLIIVNRDKLKTLPVGIAQLVLSEEIYMETGLPDYGLMMAGATVSFIPMLIIFILFQKWFVKGIFTGAIKE